MFGNKIIKKGQHVRHWPDSSPRHIHVTRADSEGNEYEAEPLISEVKLEEFVQSLRLKKHDLRTLATLIEAYGEDKYQDGTSDEQMANAGADL